VDLRTAVTRAQYDRAVDATKLAGLPVVTDVLRRLWAECEQLRSNHAESTFMQGLDQEIT